MYCSDYLSYTVNYIYIYIYIYIYSHGQKISAPYNAQQSFIGFNKSLKWGEISLWNKCFSLIHIGQNYWHPFIKYFLKPPFGSLTAYNVWWGQRTPDKRSEIIPSSRITPDPSDSQIHDGASSLQFTSLVFYRVQIRGLDYSKSLVFCSVTHFCVVFEVCVWIIVRLEDPNMAHSKILKDSVTCWYLIISMIPCV